MKTTANMKTIEIDAGIFASVKVTMFAIVVGHSLNILVTNIVALLHQHLSNVLTVGRGSTVLRVRSRRCQNIVTLDQEEMRVLVQDVTILIDTARN